MRDDTDLQPMLRTARSLLALAAVAVAAAEESCGKLVECSNESSTVAVPKAKNSIDIVNKKSCPGSPTCSGHGKCHSVTGAPSCKCDSGFFGKDCSHKKFDCASLASCGDCQDPANTKFCGWCADGRYCVPKHVHKALDTNSKHPPTKRQCMNWFPDSCPVPKRPPLNAGNETRLGFEVEGDEWGDEQSIALAEALVAMIDEKGGRGTAGTLGSIVLLLMAVCGARLAYNERRAMERQKRYDEFMQEEMASKREAAMGKRLGSFGGRKLGLAYGDDPATPVAREGATPASQAAGAGLLAPSLNGTQSLNEASLAHALGVSAGDDAAAAPPTPWQPPLPSSQPPQSAAAAQAERALRDEAVRGAAERDLQERKAKQRQRADEARQAAAAAERGAAEEAARQALQSQTKAALAASADQAAAAPQEPVEPLPAAFGKEEQEFLKALDDL